MFGFCSSLADDKTRITTTRRDETVRVRVRVRIRVRVRVRIWVWFRGSYFRV